MTPTLAIWHNNLSDHRDIVQSEVATQS